MSLKDKNVVVTGGSRGLGLGLVEALVAHGAAVTVVARNADALKFVRAELGGRGGASRSAVTSGPPPAARPRRARP